MQPSYHFILSYLILAICAAASTSETTSLSSINPAHLTYTTIGTETWACPSGYLFCGPGCAPKGASCCGNGRYCSGVAPVCTTSSGQIGCCGTEDSECLVPQTISLAGEALRGTIL